MIGLHGKHINLIYNLTTIFKKSEPEFRAVVDNLPEYLKDFARFAYFTGMRKGEIASLRWEDCDVDVIRLRAENAKNGRAMNAMRTG
jgi:integrase